jgi:hypothetical protein
MLLGSSFLPMFAAGGRVFIWRGTWIADAGGKIAAAPSLSNSVLSNAEFTNSALAGWNTAGSASVAGRDFSVSPLLAPTGGADNFGAEVQSTGSNSAALRQDPVISTGAWVVAECRGYSPSTNTVVNAARLFLSGTTALQIQTSAEDVWQTLKTAGIVTGTYSTRLRVLSTTSGDKGYFDAVMAKTIPLSTAMQTIAGQFGTISAKIFALQTGLPGGIVGWIDSTTNPQNGLVAFHDGTAVYLYRILSGVWTPLTSATVNFASDARIEIRRQIGNVFELWYNGAQRGTSQTVSDAGIINNTIHGLFGTDATVIFSEFSVDGAVVPFPVDPVIYPPSGFGYTAPFDIYQHYGTRQFYADPAFSIESYAPTGVAYYVDVDAGNDSNNGTTASTPFKSLYKVAQKTDYGAVYIKPGIYRYNIGGLQGLTFTRSAAFYRWGSSGSVILALGIVAGLTWVQDSTHTNLWRTSLANCNAVSDATQIDGDGDYVRYTLAASAAVCDATENTYYISGSTVYVHRPGAIAATDSDIWLQSTVNNMRLSGNNTFYMENIKFVGGYTRACYAFNTAAGESVKVYAKNCEFNQALTNGLQIHGGDAILANCTARKNGSDGFNYHASNGILNNVIEIDCISIKNGVNSSVTNENGSSIHDGGKIVRINGSYRENYGPNIADVNVGTQSWILGAVVADSTAAGLSDVGIRTYDGWLDTCDVSGHTYDIADDNDSGGVCRVRNTEYSTSEGTVTTY